MKQFAFGVIGAGMAGLACANRMARAGCDVVVFDKGRGPGGRMASRRVDLGGETVRFDHGTRHFTARDPRFVAQVLQWEADGIVAPWPAAGADQFVGVPGMNAPLHALAEGVDVRWNSKVEMLGNKKQFWSVTADGEEFVVGDLVVAIPPEQAAELFSERVPLLHSICKRAQSRPCWTVMAAFDQRLPIENDVISDPGSPIANACRDSAKPGRSGPERWVIQASPEQSSEILEYDPEAAAEFLLREFFVRAKIDPVTPIHSAAHRWRYAAADPIRVPNSQWYYNGPKPLPDPATDGYDEGDRRLALAGDWLVSGDVEGAYLSGIVAAQLLGVD